MTDLLVKERPVLFQAAMVLAILAGTKTQTRRAIKPQPTNGISYINGNFVLHGRTVPIAGGSMVLSDPNAKNIYSHVRCPYGKFGEHLYVRETFYAYGQWEQRYSEKKGKDEWHFIDRTLALGLSYQYEEIPGYKKPKRSDGLLAWYKRPAIHMPRKASRILLEIADVRVERLNDISEEDAKAEGVDSWLEDMEAGYLRYYKDYLDPEGGWEKAKLSFETLWASINGSESWDGNPWVWVVSFKVVS